MIDLSQRLAAKDLLPKIKQMWDLSAQKITSIEGSFDPATGAPVFTVEGHYSTRGWTEWTQGFQFGASILQFDATGDESFLVSGRRQTVDRMATHLTHSGVHDHGFNNISTYGNLLRLMQEGRVKEGEWERAFYELALKCSGAVQAARWTQIDAQRGYIYSFNGPHSLFADTMRSLRSLAVAHQLGQVLMGENDRRHSLLQRLIEHALATADFIVYYGEGRDGWDVPGRTAHEAIFNPNDFNFRCPGSQQGYSPFTAWTRGLAWVICGYAEELEWLDTLPDSSVADFAEMGEVKKRMRRALEATCDFYIAETPSCGVPYWDAGAPGLVHLGDFKNSPADPFNPYEPVDSSAAAIAVQGLLRGGRYLQRHGEKKRGDRYWQAGLKILDTLLELPYISHDPDHQGLLLHSVYHWPNRWDYIPKGSTVAHGESTMWGDYHLREAALYVQRVAVQQPYLAFFNIG